MNKTKYDSLPKKGQHLANRLINKYGTIAHAARMLGIKRQTLYRKMEKGETIKCL